MRHQSDMIRSTQFIAFVGLILISKCSLADPIWKIINETDYLETLISIEAPDNAYASLPIEVSLAYLNSLRHKDVIEIRTSRDISVNFSIADILSFPNGEKGWHGESYSNHGIRTISMTAGHNYFLASVITPENSYKVIAKKQNNFESYIGWIFLEKQLQSDSGRGDEVVEHISAPIPPKLFSLEKPAVTVSLSAKNSDGKFIFPGDLTVWTISVKNTFDQDWASLDLDIGGKWGEDLEFPDTSIMLDYPQNCRDSGSEPYKLPYTITCQIDLLEANSSVEFIMKSRGRDPAYTGELGFLTAMLSYEVGGEFQVVMGSYNEGESSPVYVKDYLIDADLDGVTDFNERLLKTDPNDGNSASEEDVVIDVAVLYTASFNKEFSGYTETQINSEFTFVNEIFSGSNTGVKFNVVHYELLDYVNNCDAPRCSPDQKWNDTQTVLDEFGRKNKNRWRVSEKIRALHGADLVVILDGPGGEDPTAGMAISGGNMRGLIEPHNRTVFVHQYINDESWKRTTLTHELGHLFSLAHSRRQDKSEESFAWATGHGEDFNFATMMAYFDKFSATRINRFSDPSRSDCGYATLGSACGVDRSDSVSGADSVGAMRVVRYQMEKFSPTRPVLSTLASDRNSYSAKFLAGAIKDIELGFKTKFKPSDAITAKGTINVAAEHIGKTGITHIIVEAGSLGTFQVNSAGQFVGLDMSKPVLVGSIEPKPLNGIEDLMVLNEFVAGPLGVLSATLNIFFGYTVIDTGLVVYSAKPLIVEISE